MAHFCIDCGTWYDAATQNFYLRDSRPYPRCKKCHNRHRIGYGWNNEGQRRRYDLLSSDAEFQARRRGRQRIMRFLNPEDEKARKQRRRASLVEAQGTFSAQEWRELCESCNNVCLACGTAGPLSADHIRPLALGGSNSIDNIQPLCVPCNSSKALAVIDYR
jgi:5-methylcytosine-specific restriction endonuclease McrA